MRAPARRGSRPLGAVLAVLLAAVTVLFSSGVASAHAYLRGSDPAEGATVQSMPATVTLDFNETIRNFEPIVVVTGPDGKNHATGAVSVIGNAVSTAVSTAAPAGVYSMAYRVVSADGHPVEGQVRFSVVAAVAGSASTDASENTTGPGSTTAGSSTVSSAAPSPTGSSAAGSSTPAPPADASSTVGKSSGPDWWLWVAIAVAAAVLAVAGFITLRRPRED